MISLLVAMMVVSTAAQQTREGADKSDTESAKTLGERGKQFLKDASIGNMAEVEMAQLAEQKAGASEVKQFAQRMERDLSSGEDQLKSVAAACHVALPTTLDAKHKDAKASISNLSGAQFDRAYMTRMVQEHTVDVQKVQRHASSANNQSVKQFASATLPILQEHLKDAKELLEKIQSGSLR